MSVQFSYVAMYAPLDGCETVSEWLYEWLSVISWTDGWLEVDQQIWSVKSADCCSKTYHRLHVGGLGCPL